MWQRERGQLQVTNDDSKAERSKDPNVRIIGRTIKEVSVTPVEPGGTAHTLSLTFTDGSAFTCTVEGATMLREEPPTPGATAAYFLWEVAPGDEADEEPTLPGARRK
jgi:hypothetical protein